MTIRHGIVPYGATEDYCPPPPPIFYGTTVGLCTAAIYSIIFYFKIVLTGKKVVIRR